MSVVSPCYNEEDNVRTCYETVRRIFADEMPEYNREHIFADNSSTDRTIEILRQIAAEDENVKVIVNSRNFGLFRSTFNALQYATGDATLVMLPVDLQDPPELLPEFVRLWESGYEVVAGIRSERREGILMLRARRTFYRIVNRLAGFEIPENVGEFQLIDRKVLDNVLRFNDHYPYIRGIIAACGFKRVLIPYSWRRRSRGFSKIRLLELIDQALNGIFSFTNVPMRVATFLGLALATICILYALITVAVFFFSPRIAPPGITSLVIGLFFLVGVQLIFTGLLGEYVTSVHAQVRRGPLVIERERINVDAIAPLQLRTEPVGAPD
ncbi:MAG: glycosyltransferase family 2 protein [Deltaproteobacteria bacterium]|nr:glycosyltransferase family 2 protein [Deltaproteobacteria bacterium]